MTEVAPLPSIEVHSNLTAGPSASDSKKPETKLSNAFTPPASEESNKDHASTASELSELDVHEEVEDDDDDDNDIGEVEPDHYYEGGRIPVFKPTMDQFRSFKKFVDKIDKYGMKSGIVKVIPPKEWRDSLPALDEAVKTIKVKNPITQEFSGTHGTYTQANIEKQRSYILPQWKALTEESQHQPPARRGERRKNQDKPSRPSLPRAPRTPSAPKPKPEPLPEGVKRRPGRPRKHPLPQRVEDPEPEQQGTLAVKQEEQEEEADGEEEEAIEEKEIKAPPTPTSPHLEPDHPAPSTEGPVSGGPAQRLKQEAHPKRKRSPAPRSKGRQPKSVAERRKYNRAETSDYIDEAAFKNFDYRFYPGEGEFTPERCAELEALYWRTLTFAAPMYGADMPGSLFNESTESWNVAKLENLLDVLGQKVPGVNTAYLYLGMWKATFAWHLEDVDLYSINYIHFGAPKQWYSISQEDARRFENAMKNVWPNDAKNCSQFLRHKTYLISPALLQSQYNIKVNKLVHYEGEFVITFPYGYHSGYNLGYNCAESVNFATEQWLEFGRIAKKCDCEADSVWIDVGEIERKLRGEPTPEYYEYTDDEDMDGAEHLPSPPPSVAGKSGSRKRKRGEASQQGKKAVKKIKIRIRPRSAEPCALCPNDLPSELLLPTDNDRKAHLVCALYTPETYVGGQEGFETVYNVANIDKARLGLKCSFCRSKKGACFQCSSRKCTRAYHATCAAPAGVQVDFGPTAVYGEDGTEYASECFDFRCRFHRPKRPKMATAESLESNSVVRKYAKTLQPRDAAQVQFLNGDIFAGTVVENRHSERALVLDILPDGDQIEVEWRWVLAVDPAESQIPRPSPDAKPLPAHLTRQIPPDRNAEFGPPQEGDAFNDPEGLQKWAEFHTAPAPHNSNQVTIDFDTPNHLWYYMGKDSTDARPKYTEDLALPRHNPASLPKEPSHGSSAPSAQSSLAKQALNTQNLIGPSYHSLSGATAATKYSQQNSLPRPSGHGKPHFHKPQAIGGSATAEGEASVSNKESDSHGSPAFLFNPYQAFSRSDSRPNYESEDQQRSSGVQGELSNSDDQKNQHAAALLALASSSPNAASAYSASVSQEHAQLIAKLPYLRQSFCRRDSRYVSPYPSAGGFSQSYAAFLPQSRSASGLRPWSAEYGVERSIAQPHVTSPADVPPNPKSKEIEQPLASTQKVAGIGESGFSNPLNGTLVTETQEDVEQRADSAAHKPATTVEQVSPNSYGNV